MDGWMRGWMDGWMDRQIDLFLQILFPKMSKLHHVKYLASAIKWGADP